MVRSGELYSFRHALGHEAVYGDLLPGERAALHERVAIALAAHPELALGEDPALTAAELAHHWHAAGRLPESLAASVRAGQAAELAHAPIEAQLHYRRALELWPRVADAADGRRDRPARGCSSTPPRSPRWPGATTAPCSSPISCSPSSTRDREPERHARILDRRALYSWHAGDLTTSKRATAALREGVESGVTLAVVTRLCGVAYQAALELRYLDALALARDALAAARQDGRAGRRSATPCTCSARSKVISDATTTESAACTSRSTSPSQGDDAERIGSTWHNLVEAYVFAGRAAEAVDLAERGLVDLERLGLHRTYAALTTGQLTLALLALGRWDRGRRRQRGVCSPAMSTRTSPSPSTSAGSTCSSARAASPPPRRCSAELGDQLRRLRLHRRRVRRVGSRTGDLAARLAASPRAPSPVPTRSRRRPTRSCSSCG